VKQFKNTVRKGGRYVLRREIESGDALVKVFGVAREDTI
jgi:hypothetical protein